MKQDKELKAGMTSRQSVTRDIFNSKSILALPSLRSEVWLFFPFLSACHLLHQLNSKKLFWVEQKPFEHHRDMHMKHCKARITQFSFYSYFSPEGTMPLPKSSAPSLNVLWPHKFVFDHGINLGSVQTPRNPCSSLARSLPASEKSPLHL